LSASQKSDWFKFVLGLLGGAIGSLVAISVTWGSMNNEMAHIKADQAATAQALQEFRSQDTRLTTLETRWVFVSDQLEKIDKKLDKAIESHK